MTYIIGGTRQLDSVSIAAELDSQFKEEIPEAFLTVLPPPPVRGVGRAGGFKIMIEDRESAGLLRLQEATDGLVDFATNETDPVTAQERRRPEFVPGMSSVFRANVPQVYVDLNRNAAMTKEVEINDIFQTPSGFSGIALCQRLQSVRPDLAGDRAERHAVSRPDRGHPAAQDPQPARPDGALGVAGRTSR